MNAYEVFSTAKVPARFLKAAYLVGSIPFKSLESEPRVSYTLYIPEKHYCAYAKAQPQDGAAVGALESEPARLPLLVNIHGTRRGAERCRDNLIPFAEEMGMAVLAPLFPAGVDSVEALHNYKVLRQNDFHADTAFLSILDEVKVKWPGIATEKVFMMGFSGGGQFVHRFLYIHPERLHAASVGAPGRVTKLDESANWPAGTKNVDEIFGVARVNVETIRKVTVQLVCGELDNEVHGGEGFWEWFNSMQAKYSERDGATKPNASNDAVGKAADRIGTLRQVLSDWEALGIKCQLDVVPDAKHETDKMLPTVLKFLRPLIESCQRHEGAMDS